MPESLQGKRVLSIDLSAIMAGSGIRGQFEEKFKALIKDIEDEVRGLYAYEPLLRLTRNRLAMLSASLTKCTHSFNWARQKAASTQAR